MTSAELSNFAVTATKLAANSVSTQALQDQVVSSLKVADNSLTGSDVNEASLGVVPDADRVDGLDARKFVFAVPAATSTTTVLHHSSLIIRANCDAYGDIDVWAETLLNHAAIHTASVRAGGNAAYNDDNDFNLGETVLVVGDQDSRIEGTITYVPYADHAVSVTYIVQEGAFMGGLAGCLLAGTSFGG